MLWQLYVVMDGEQWFQQHRVSIFSGTSTPDSVKQIRSRNWFQKNVHGFHHIFLATPTERSNLNMSRHIQEISQLELTEISRFFFLCSVESKSNSWSGMYLSRDSVESKLSTMCCSYMVGRLARLSLYLLYHDIYL
jgi:hypothetical protein